MANHIENLVVRADAPPTLGSHDVVGHSMYPRSTASSPVHQYMLVTGYGSCATRHQLPYTSILVVPNESNAANRANATVVSPALVGAIGATTMCCADSMV